MENNLLITDNKNFEIGDSFKYKKIIFIEQPLDKFSNITNIKKIKLHSYFMKSHKLARKINKLLSHLQIQSLTNS